MGLVSLLGGTRADTASSSHRNGASSPPALYPYVAVVSCAGVALLAIFLVTGSRAALSDIRSTSWVLLLLMMVTELVPVRVPRRTEQEEITISTPFSFALLLSNGLVIALLGQALVSLVADLVYRKPLYKSFFNVAQYTLSFSASAALLAAMSDVPRPQASPFFTPGDLPAILAAALVFFLVNNALTGTALALAQGVRVIAFLRSDLAFRAATDGALIALAPVVVTAAQFSVALIPLFALPLLAVHIAGRQSVMLASVQERQHLFEKLSKVEASISHRAPLQEVLDAIVVGARELLDDDVVSLRRIDRTTPVTRSSPPPEASHPMSLKRPAGPR